MTDAELRALERRWQGSRAVDDEVALLVARVRAGDLGHERLRLAAYLGHRAAQLACADESLEVPTATLEDLEAWCVGLRAFGRDVCARTAIAAASTVLGRWEKRCPGEDTPRKALDAARAWVECPCVPHAGLAETAGDRAWRVADSDRRASHGATMAALAAGAAAQEAGGVRVGGPAGPLHSALSTVQAALGAGTRGRAKLFDVLREGLVPWALGLDAPR